MALKYNNTTNLITTDDIIVTSNVSELGENLSDILETQSNDIAQLKSNVKWIAKYGGVGGGGSGSGGGGIATNTKFNLKLSYTDNNGISQSVTATQKDKEIVPILSKINKLVSITVTITSTINTTTIYRAIFDKGDGSPISQIIPVAAGYTTFTFNAEEIRYNCNITISGETTSTISFSVFTQIISNESFLSSGDQRFNNDASVDPSFREGLCFNAVLENLLPDAFDLYLDNIILNNEVICSSSPETDQKVLINKIQSVEDKFTSYGLYNIILNYHAIDKATDKRYDYSPSYVYIYKESNKAFVYCYTDELSDFVIYNERTENPVGTNLRNIPLYFRVYGQTGDTISTTYNVDINGITYKRPCKIMQNYSYSLPNEALDEDNYQEVAIEFNVNGIITTYYIYLKNPGELSYIFKKDGIKCYGAIGDNTDAVVKNGSISFPNRIAGETYWSFISETENRLIVNQIPETYISPNIVEGTQLSVLNFIQSTQTASGIDGLMYDGIINIGINYKDTSYDKAIFTLTDKMNNTIDFYRNKIQNGQQDTTNRFGMPDDGKFHLITIYFKQNYSSVLNPNVSNSWDGVISFAVYIDGVLDVKPTRTAFTFGQNCVCTFHAGNNQYNFFGVETFNPISMGISTVKQKNIYQGAVKKYLQDYDPFIVSNYFMCYASAHYQDLGYTSQPFTEEQLKVDSSVYYSSLISNSSQNYINYYNTEGSTYNKFIPINIQTFSNLLDRETTVPIYRIVPVYSNSDISGGLHTLVLNTMTSYRENDNDPLIKSGYECKFQRYDLNENVWKDIIEDYTDSNGITHQVKYRVKYQGSSTLLYSVKNFAIETIPFYIEESNTTYTYYFNPDSDVFDYPETSFNLKADLVDSSSCTNNVMGNFINDYMSSPFNDNNHNKTLGNEFKTCLSGRPVLLFMNNNITNDTSKVTDDLFLGIYNLNLNRGSVNNLGYQQILDTNLQKIDGNFENIYWQITTQNTSISVPDGLTVAEVQGNGNVYDFSQYDYGLLNQIFGDFYTVSGGRVTEEYNNAIQLLGRDFALYVRNNIVSQGQTEVFPATDYGITSEEFTNYYNEFNSSNELSKLRYYRMQGGGISLTEIPQNSIIVDYNTMEGLKPSYKTTINDKSVVGNSNYQFHLVYDINGTPPAPFYKNSSYYYYVEDLGTTVYDPESNQQTFDLDNSIKYYIVCMAFAMVDSVQKNLNIKRPNNGTIWYPQFYDMDTALGLDNSGNNSNYKAFSDFVREDGMIISDYADQSASEWFDTPSSYLFLYAKYDALLNQRDNDGLKDRTPIQYWLSLRGVTSRVLDLDCVGALENADKFCNKYLNTYITNDIPPIVWNLNYLYKYFSETKNTGGANNDTEESRFNGRMIYRRRTWLSQRLHYLDALFGISNSRPIGNSNIRISEGEIPDTNPDIEIVGTMFPGFQKGVTGVTVNAVVKDQPRTPLIFRTNTDNYTLYITDDQGEATIRDVKINSNVDVAFSGTKHLISISNCGNLLQNSTILKNTIVGDQIEKIVISSSCKSAIIDLNNLPAVKEIIIHSSPNSPSINAAFITIDEIQIKGNEANPPEVRIFIQNVSCKNINISNCIFRKGTTDGTNSKIYGITGNCIISISGCNFQTATTIGGSTSKISQFTLFGNSFVGNLTVQSISSCKLTANNITFNNGNVFSIVASLLTEINISNSRIFTLTHDSSANLQTCNIGLVNNNSGTASTAYIVLNKTAADGNFLFNINTGSQYNPRLTELTISLEGNYGIGILRAPLFGALTTLNLTGKFKLGRMGLAGAGLPQVTLDPTQDNGIIGFSVSNSTSTSNYAKGSQGIFLGFNGAFVNKDGNALTVENWKGLINGVYTLQYAFANRTSGLAMDEVVNILTAIKNNTATLAASSCNIWGLFHGTNIINSNDSAVKFSSLSEDTRYELIDRIVNAWPTNASNDGSLIFQRTNFDVLTKELANKISSKVYQNFMGNGSTQYIEIGALNSFTIITDGVLSASKMSWSAGSSNVQSYYPSTHFFTKDEDNVTQYNDLEIKYSQQFSQATTLRLQVYTSVSNNISFDYENGMGNKIENYQGLFNLGGNVGNVYNIQKMFNNTPNLSEVSFDFNAFSLSISDLNDPRVVDLYQFLVDTSSETHKLIDKAYNVLSSRGDTEDHWNQGSFYKKITGENFKKLLKLLHDSKKDNIRCIFHNCTVLKISQDPRDFFRDAFVGNLCEFKSLYAAFRKCKFLDSNGDEIPIILDNAFTSVTTVDDETTISKSTSVATLARAFELCFIEPFTSDLGISSSVTNGFRAFANCTFNYSIVERPINQHQARNIMSFPVPSEQVPILPKNFLKCCKSNTELAAKQMFAYDTDSRFDTTHLTGCFPEETNYFGNGIILLDTFQRCNIYYHVYDIKEQDDITTTQWIIFPKWYTASAKSESIGPFGMYIPLPIQPERTNEKYICSIFGKSEDIALLQSSYGKLPRFPSVVQGITTFGPILLGSKGNDPNLSPDSIIYLTLNENHELPRLGSNFKGILPSMLSPVVYITGADSTIVSDILSASISEENYKPINETAGGLTQDIIFKGAIDGVTVGDQNIFKVIAFS